MVMMLGSKLLPFLAFRCCPLEAYASMLQWVRRGASAAGLEPLLLEVGA